MLIEKIDAQEKSKFKVIGKKQGYKHDYDYINLLTYRDAKDDHFREVLGWLKD